MGYIIFIKKKKKDFTQNINFIINFSFSFLKYIYIYIYLNNSMKNQKYRFMNIKVIIMDLYI